MTDWNTILPNIKTDIVDIKKNNPDLKPHASGEHNDGRVLHQTELFQSIVASGIYLRWSYCPKCITIRQKYLTRYYKDEDGDYVASIYDFIKNGVALAPNDRLEF